MAQGREKEIRRREREEEVEQMDPDTFGMSPEKRAFTVERVDMNANAPGRRSHSHKYEIVSLFRPSLSFNSIFFPRLYLAYSPRMSAISLFVCLCVCVSV